MNSVFTNISHKAHFQKNIERKTALVVSRIQNVLGFSAERLASNQNLIKVFNRFRLLVSSEIPYDMKIENKLTVKRHKIFWSFAKLYTIQLEGVIQFYWGCLVWREISAGRPAAAYVSCMLCVLHAHAHTHTHTANFGAEVKYQSALPIETILSEAKLQK